MLVRFWKRSETWGLGLAILTLIVMTLFTLHTWSALQAARDEVAHTQQLDREAADVLTTALNAETGQRGFLLTSDETYLEPFNRASSLLDAQLNRLHKLTSTDPAQSARVTRAQTLAERKLAELRATIEIGRSQGLKAALALVETGRGKHTMDQLRATLGEIQHSQELLEAELQGRVDEYSDRMPIYIGGGAGLLLVLLVAAFMAIRREAEGREQALERAEQSRTGAVATRDLLDLTLRAIGDAVLTADADGRLTMINSAAREVTGWGDEALGQDVHEVFRIINEYTRKPVESPIDKIRRTGAVVGLANHTLIVRKDGSEVPIDDSGAPIRDHNGKLAGFVLVFRDITERKQSEDALRASEQRLRTVANAAPALLWLADADGAISFFNQEWLTFTGSNEDSQLGSGWQHGIHPDDLEEVKALYKKGIQSRQRFHYQARLRRADGEWRRLLCATSPHGESAGYVTACFDITDLQEAQRSLEISERRFRSIVDGTTALVWQTNAAGQFVTRMPQWEEFTGQRWPSYRGSGGMEAIHPADRPSVVHDWQAALQERQSFSAEYRLWNAPSQTWRHVTARGVPLLDASGEPIEWVGTLTDDTERRELEQKLRQSVKAESLGVLAGGIAHDFNNLLVGILGNASLLESALADPADRELASEIIQAGERAAALTQQMLAYSGRGRFVVDSANLAREIDRLNPRLRALLPPHVSLRLELERALPEVEIDRTQIEQLLCNLILNAAEAIDGANGAVTVATRVAALSTDVSDFVLGDRLDAGSYVVLEVRDTGHGIDAATQSRIFDPFFTTKFTGRGLGLPAALGIARGHKGGIRVRSSPGRGSTFGIYLPACQTQTVAAEGSRPPGPASAPVARETRPLVLVVDDEEVVRSFAAGALTRYGYRVLLAENGARALELFGADPAGFAAVLLDLTMPVMNGQQTLAALRAIHPQATVIASSGYSEADAMPRFAGKLEGFIQKPYTAGDLAQAMRAVLPESKAAAGGTVTPGP